MSQNAVGRAAARHNRRESSASQTHSCLRRVAHEFTGREAAALSNNGLQRQETARYAIQHRANFWFYISAAGLLNSSARIMPSVDKLLVAKVTTDFALVWCVEGKGTHHVKQRDPALAKHSHPNHKPSKSAERLSAKKPSFGYQPHNAHRRIMSGPCNTEGPRPTEAGHFAKFGAQQPPSLAPFGTHANLTSLHKHSRRLTEKTSIGRNRAVFCIRSPRNTSGNNEMRRHTGRV